jgi:hypothetical protein
LRKKAKEIAGFTFTLMIDGFGCISRLQTSAIAC